MSDPFVIEEVVQAIPMPAPIITYTLQPQSVVHLTYRLDYTDVDYDAVFGLLGAGALYSEALAKTLYKHLTIETRAGLKRFGFSRRRGFGNDPRHLLRWEPRPWQAWDF
jgi:hypothetical protein